MKSKYISVWIKELCSLVFVQSIQALVFSVVFSLIIGLYVDAVSSKSASDYYVLGLYAIIALSSLSKLELLTKSLFGLNSGLANEVSMGRGGESFFKSALAIKGVAKLGNNIPSMVGGLAGVASSAVGSLRLKKYDGKTGTKSGSKSGSSSGNTTAGRKLGGANRSSRSALNNMTVGELMDGLKDKSPEEKLADKKEQLREKRSRNLRRMTSGVLETLGSVGGASVGAVVGLAQGKDIVHDMAIGAGIGDSAGKFINNTAYGMYDTINNFVSEQSEIGKLKNKVDATEAAGETMESVVDSNASSSNTQEPKRVITGARTMNINNKQEPKRVIKGAKTMNVAKKESKPQLTEEKIEKARRAASNTIIKKDNPKRVITGAKTINVAKKEDVGAKVVIDKINDVKKSGGTSRRITGPKAQTVKYTGKSIKPGMSNPNNNIPKPPTSIDTEL